jgi:hypothetical protein
MTSKPTNHARSDEEMAVIRERYLHSMEAAKDWCRFSDNVKFHSNTFWMLITNLFVYPGLTRSDLIDKIRSGKKVSISTAERSIDDVIAAGFVRSCSAEGKRAKKALYLSEELEKHCLDFYDKYMS